MNDVMITINSNETNNQESFLVKPVTQKKEIVLDVFDSFSSILNLEFKKNVPIKNAEEDDFVTKNMDDLVFKSTYHVYDKFDLRQRYATLERYTCDSDRKIVWYIRPSGKHEFIESIIQMICLKHKSSGDRIDTISQHNTIALEDQCAANFCLKFMEIDLTELNTAMDNFGATKADAFSDIIKYLGSKSCETIPVEISDGGNNQFDSDGSKVSMKSSKFDIFVNTCGKNKIFDIVHTRIDTIDEVSNTILGTREKLTIDFDSSLAFRHYGISLVTLDLIRNIMAMCNLHSGIILNNTIPV